jgi:hypothetical protein
MRVCGSIKDAATQRPIPGANVDLAFADMELAKLSCDKAGRFEYREEPQYIGEVLNCHVKKRGYEPKEVYYKIEHEEIHIDIELVPERIELNLNLKDEKRNPLDGVKITLEVDGEQIGIGFSDKNGLVKITLSPDLEEKTIKFKAELGGFEVATGEIQLRKETSHEICIKKVPVPPPPAKWLKIVAMVSALAVAVIVAAIVIPPPPEEPQIVEFKAAPPVVTRGESSSLMWETSNAEEVEIHPTVGSIELSGSKEVRPRETTIYTLTARNQEGKEAEKRTSVEVIIPKPIEIHFFKATPPVIKRGESSTLRWKTSNAEKVVISGIGWVNAFGERTIQPGETNTYILIAKNREGETAKREVAVEVIAPKPPKIHFFEADPPSILKGEKSILRWSTENADEVEMHPKVGHVEPFGSRDVSPKEDTTYVLIAKKEEGEGVERMVTVQVIVSWPDVQSRCEQYAGTAIEQNEENLKRHCGFTGPRWSSDYNAHYQWCCEVPRISADLETKIREDALKKQCQSIY